MLTSVKGHKTFLLDKRQSRSKWFTSLGAERVSIVTSLRHSIAEASRDSLWISFDPAQTNALLKSVEWPSPPLGILLLLHRPELSTLPALSDCFREVVFSTDGAFLPLQELAEVLAAENKRDLFIGGSVDRASGTLTLWRGDLTSLTVPLHAFAPSGTGTKPNFDAFAITDYGHTIQFGPYEAAGDAVLYEYDRDYRRRKAKERLANDRTLGASLRRLRKQRRLRREDFAPLSPKTIARIEQGKVQRVHPRTLKTIAERLGVSVEELGEF